MRIAVAGGRGLAGTFVGQAARAAGHEVSIIARSAGADLITGDGLDDALRGVSAVIDVSNVTTTSRRRATTFFEAGTRNLLAAELRAGVGHHVLLSIVGVDRVHLGYYQAKQAQEDLALAGPVPVSILRATQFFEFAGQLMGRSRGPVAFVPRMRSQPIAAQEVGQALAGLAAGAPAGMAPELAGPQEFLISDLAGQVLRATGHRRLVVPIPIPGAVGRAIRSGGLLPARPGPRGTISFSEWLASSARPGVAPGAGQ